MHADDNTILWTQQDKLVANTALKYSNSPPQRIFIIQFLRNLQFENVLN